MAECGADVALARAQDVAARAGLELRQGSNGLVLTDGSLMLEADFSHLLPRIQQGALQRELLVRAAKVKGVHAAAAAGGDDSTAAPADLPLAIDATAGLGEDSLLLAASGYRVRLYECNPVIAALLHDALRKAGETSGLASIAARMEVIEGDSVAALRAMAADGGAADAGTGTPVAPSPILVYLDPMFPGRTKSAAVKKKFQLLHHLEQPCADERELLDAALSARPRKVVVKRPVKGPYLAGVRPSHSLAGKAVRYDVIVPPRP